MTEATYRTEIEGRRVATFDGDLRYAGRPSNRIGCMSRYTPAIELERVPR